LVVRVADANAQVQTRRVNVDWRSNVHVVVFAPLDPYYLRVESFEIPNNSIAIIRLPSEDRYVLITSNDDGEFVEVFEGFEELNNHLRREFGLELNRPEGEDYDPNSG